MSGYVKMDEKQAELAKKYINFCKEGNLLSDRKFVRVEKPKVSTIIPMYNEEKNILKVIRSIQNQSLQEIEIVCVNDNSKDNTLKILEDLQKEDPRITIITNKYNRGVLYNRIYGAIQSKGEYVTFIDADDALCNYEILANAYFYAAILYKENIDIVHYQTCGATKKDSGELDQFVIFFTFNPNNFNQVIKQPEIGDNYMQKKKNITGSGFVFDKIYSKELIYRIADYISPQIWNQNLIYMDDFLLAFASMKKANSIVNIGEIGYFHLIDLKTSVTSNVWEIEGNKLKSPEKTNKKIGDLLLILERIYYLTDNEPQTEEFRENILNFMLDKDYLPTIARSIHYDRYLSLFEKLYVWKHTKNETKTKIKDKVKFILSYKIDPTEKYANIIN
jgi:glycosyltransferase involved in cell wall biosynthesis